MCWLASAKHTRGPRIELHGACKLVDEPVVTLSTDANPISWAGNNNAHGDLKQMCGISGKGKLYSTSTSEKRYTRDQAGREKPDGLDDTR